MILFLFITACLIGGFVFLIVRDNTNEIAGNWAKYRCSPTVMPFAALYGYNTSENFNFCLGSIFQGQAFTLMNPLTSVLATIIQSIQTFIESINSLRLQLATLVGGVNKIAQEFTDRVTQLMLRVRVASMRMRMLMGRMFATFYAIIYMGMSGITAVMNFGDSFLFKFLDTFCFPPETLVEMEHRGLIPISSVKVGDTFKNGSCVTATFSFFADGQEMVEFPNGLQVSTNHYVKWQGNWIQARYHPEAKPYGQWNGGINRPLICLNTKNHILPIGGYTFMDYDETEKGDFETMKWVEESVNAGGTSVKAGIEYSPSIAPETLVLGARRTKEAYSIAARDIKLGDFLKTGRVVGIIQKKVKHVSRLPTGERVGEGTLVWDSEKSLWKRAYSEGECESQVFLSFIVSPTAQIELESGSHIRDYMEVHSPETEQFYTRSVEKGFPNLEKGIRGGIVV